MLRYAFYAEIDVRVSVILLPQLRHLEAVECGSHVEYHRGGKTLLVDWGGSVDVMSEIEADIDDAITLLLAKQPKLASLGIAIAGTSTFVEAATRILGQRGIAVRNAGVELTPPVPLKTSSVKSPRF